MARQTDATDGSLMDTIEALAGEGRVPVDDLTGPEDPRLNIDTPEGTISTKRVPDRVIKEGSSTRRRWFFGGYMLEEDRDWQPGLEHPHAVVVKQIDN